MRRRIGYPLKQQRRYRRYSAQTTRGKSGNSSVSIAEQELRVRDAALLSVQ